MGPYSTHRRFPAPTKLTFGPDIDEDTPEVYLHYFGIPYAFNGGVTPPGCPAGAKNGEDDVSVYFYDSGTRRLYDVDRAARPITSAASVTWATNPPGKNQPGGSVTDPLVLVLGDVVCDR